MSDKDEVKILFVKILREKGVHAWNQWREENLAITPDLSGANLIAANLNGANLSEANLSEANLSEANLSEADLRGANFIEADLRGANLDGVKINGATNFSGAKLDGTILSVGPRASA